MAVVQVEWGPIGIRMIELTNTDLRVNACI